MSLSITSISGNGNKKKTKNLYRVYLLEDELLD